MNGVANLVCCTSQSNHNKYYNMRDNGDGTFTAEYGRVGSAPQTATYPSSQWSKKYNEKLNKGYKDVTDKRTTVVVQSSHRPKLYSDVKDDSVLAIINELQAYATKTIRENYLVNETAVTDKMVKTVEDAIKDLDEICNKVCSLPSSASQAEIRQYVNRFNNILEDVVFPTIPRRMGNVRDYVVQLELYSSVTSLQTRMSYIVTSERNLLNIMRTKVVQSTVQMDNAEDAGTLKALGLEIKHCSEKDFALIRKELGADAPRLVDAWCVKNIRTHEAFEKFKKENKGDYQRFPIKLLWHGSRNENWWSIINGGLQLSPKSAKITGKMFGQGIYFAPKAHKSLGYTSLRDAYWTNSHADYGFMALYATAYGKPYDVYTNTGISSSFNWNDLKRKCPEAHCVHAHAGSALRNDEIIYYKEAQCTIKYLVKLR